MNIPLRRRALFLPAILTGLFFITTAAHAADKPPAGTLDDPLIDSNMTRAEALEGVDPACPRETLDRQTIVVVKYLGVDGRIHQGQILVDDRLAKDVQEVFAVAFKEKFPIQSVIPVSDKRFRKEGKWDDGLSMAANNTSGFNYRLIDGTNRLSNHARGMAIDINPLINPWFRGDKVDPPHAKYDAKIPGTLTAESAVTKTLLRLGWDWGGDWQETKDYQHFEKPVER